MVFKSWLKKGLKSGKFGKCEPGLGNDDDSNDELTFVEDFFRKDGGCNHAPFKTWSALERFLIFKRACPEAVRAGKKLFEAWQKDEEILKRQKEKDQGLEDCLNQKDIAQIKKALRQVWSWSYSRRLVVKRCELGGGYSRCEVCKKRCPKIHVDHIEAVGVFNRDYIKRLFVPSHKLQGLCQNCHKVKTKADLKRIKASKDDFY